MIKPLLHNSFFMGFGSLANALINEATIPGRDLALTVVGGGRRSVFDPSVDIASNTADVNSNYEIMVSDGAANVVASDMALWTKGANATFEDLGDDVSRLTMPNMTSTFFTFPITIDDSYFTVALDIRNHPGSVESGNITIESRAAGPVQTYYDAVPPAEWTTIYVSKNNNSAATALYIRDTGGCDVEVRNVRYVNSSIRHPGHTIGSGASDVYPTDVVTCTPTWGSVGTIFQVATPYGWTQWTNNPSNTNARTFYENSLFETFGQISGVDINIIGNNVAGYPTDNIISTLSADWNGVYTGVRYDNVSRVSASNSYTPSSALTIGNRDLIERPFHGPIITLIFNRVLSDAEYNILRAHYIGILANRTL